MGASETGAVKTGIASVRRMTLGSMATLAAILWTLTAATVPSADAQRPKIDDADITAAIVAELTRDAAVQEDGINVETEEGVVTLSGVVPHLLAHDRAIRVAESTRAVRAVIDRLEVRPVERPDAEIKADVEQALLIDPVADSYELDVRVDQGRVTLTGVVDSWAENQVAMDVVRSVRGVVGVRSNIQVAGTEDRADSEIEAEVMRRLRSDVYVDSGTVDVEVNDGKVVLSGAVGSAAERSRATQLSWVSGVHNVDAGGLEVQWWMRDKMRRAGAPDLAISDQEIERAVKDALERDPRVDASGIHVNSSTGVVTLAGTVDHLDARRAARRDAENTVGVWKVEDRLTVRSARALSEELLQQRVEEAFARDAVLEPYRLTARVRDQEVHLYGDAPTYHVRARAQEVAERVSGVAAVVNEINVTYEATTKSDREIKEEIEDQFFWSPFVDGGDIEVEVEDGVATLRGTVDSPRELNAAIENVLQAGARSVENKLVVRDAPTQLYPQRYYPDLFWGM